jgi:hypothetical protein
MVGPLGGDGHERRHVRSCHARGVPATRVGERCAYSSHRAGFGHRKAQAVGTKQRAELDNLGLDFVHLKECFFKKLLFENMGVSFLVVEHSRFVFSFSITD